MKIFAAVITRAPEFGERHPAYREAHRQRALELKESGRVLLRGAWVDPADGSLMVFLAEDLWAARQLVEGDPYYQAGLWPQVYLREWKVNPEAGALAFPEAQAESS